MGIKNTTTLTKSLISRFNFANLSYRLRFNLVIFPLLMLACAVALYQQGGTFLYVQILVCIAIIVPLVLVLANVIIFQKNMKNYPSLNQTIKTTFSSDGFTVDSGEGESKLVSYAYMKECVEFRKLFIVYFKGASPMVIDKSGFSFGDSRSFKALMKKSIQKRSRKG